jgi:hypothetical protein
MKKIFLVILLTGVVFSCDDRFEELNRPKKNAAEVTGDALFANGVRNMFDMMASTDVNSNIFRLFSQYWAQTTYPDESQYNLVGREIPDNFWGIAYRDVLKDLDEAAVIINENFDPNVVDEATKNNQLAMIDICKVFTYSVLVDAFGAVPFSEALNDEILIPSYDPGEDVYDAIITMLDEAIATLDVDAEGFRSNQDLIYEGDVSGWLKFANSLKLRMAITISDVNSNRAETMVNEAIASGLFESNDDNAAIDYQDAPPSTNPVWEDLVQSGRADYVISNTIVDKMQELADPRLLVYAAGMAFEYPLDKVTKAERDSTITAEGQYILYYPETDEIVLKTAPFTVFAADKDIPLLMFVGGEYGTANTYSANSHVGDLFHQPDLEGLILDYSEVQFLLAEAAERNFTTPMTAEEHYNQGIRASMEYWGVSDERIEDYLAQPEVAYATAEGDWKQKIGIQSWIALYNRGFEGWNVWRRLDFTGFNVPDGLTADDIPNRLTFPIEEATLNPSNFNSAIGLIGGSDDVQTKVFWDMN